MLEAGWSRQRACQHLENGVSSCLASSPVSVDACDTPFCVCICIAELYYGPQTENQPLTHYLWCSKGRSCKDTGREAAACILRQFCPNPITKSQLCNMRASLHLNHRIDLNSGFNFMEYVAAHAEHRLSYIVGLGLPMWLFVVCFVLLSSVTGDLSQCALESHQHNW